MSLSTSQWCEFPCRACGATARYEAWLILARDEQPAAWAKARRGVLFDAPCPVGHINSVAIPTLFYDPRSRHVMFVPTDPQAAQKELNDPAVWLLQNIERDDRLDVEIIDQDEVPSALERLERAAETGEEIGRVSNRVFVFESAPRQDYDNLAKAFEHPSPASAMRIASECDRLLSSATLNERQRTDLKAQRALCFTVASDAPAEALDEAVKTFRELLPAFDQRGSKTDWAATERNLGEALLKRAPASDRAAAAEALEAFQKAAPYLTRDYSLWDWARLELGSADALIRLGGEQKVREAHGRLRTILQSEIEPDPFAVLTRARQLFDTLGAATDATVEESASRDPVDILNDLLRRRDHVALLKFVNRTLEAGTEPSFRPILLYCKGLALLNHAQPTAQETLDAVLALEEAVETGGEDQVPGAKAASLLFDAYVLFSPRAVSDLPTFRLPSGRLVGVLIEGGAALIDSDMEQAIAGLRRASKLLETDNGRAPTRTALREVLRPMFERIGALGDAAVPLAEIAARRAQLDYDDRERAEYFGVIDLFTGHLAQAGESEIAATIMAGSDEIYRALAARTGDFAPLLEHVSKLSAMLLQHGDYGDAFRYGADLVDLGRAAGADHATHDGRLGMAFALRGLGFHRDALRQFEGLLADPSFDVATMRFIAEEAAAESSIAIGNFGEAHRLLEACSSWDAKNTLLVAELEARELASTDPDRSIARLGAIADADIRRHDDVRIVLRAHEELARARIAKGELEEAAIGLNAAFNLVQHISRNDHPVRSELLELAARLELARDRPAKAFGFMKDAVRSDWATAADMLSLGSAAGRSRRLGEMRRRAEALVDLARHHYHEDPEAIAIGYQAILRTKALNAAIERRNREAVARLASPDAKASADRLAGIRARLGALAFGDAAPDALSELTDEKAFIETGLSALVPSVAIEQLIEWSTLDAVAEGLGDDTLLIDFVRHRPLVGGGVRYLAFLVARGRPARLIDIGDGSTIDEAVAACRTLASTRAPGLLQRVLSGNPASKLGKRLRELVLDPLALERETASRLIICPDGGLLSLPFELLPFQDAFLIDRFVVSYASSARALSPVPREGEHAASPPLVLGDPAYSGEAGEDRSRGLEIGFGPLPGTAIEVGEVGRLLGVGAFTGNSATKEKVVATTSPRIIHLATHGYFFPAQSAPPELRNLPLLRCGLAFANANAGPGGAGQSAGVLTAEEVLGLDLVSTELAVLSACETALGDLEEGEALAGLARSFEAAGAKSAVVSLWKVPDLPTQELMTSFYRLLADGRSLAEALRDAKLQVRRDHPWPRDWAGFILQGRSGPIRTTI